MTRYSPGDWYGVVTPAGVALLPRVVPMSTVERVWLDLRAGGGLGALIDGLVGAFGTSLSRLPEFGVIALSPDGEVRVAMRGDVTARLWLVGEAEPTLVNGSGVTTWNERLWTGVGRAELLAGDAAADHLEELLPVVDGVMCARVLQVAILDFDTQPPPNRPEELAELAALEVSAAKVEGGAPPDLAPASATGFVPDVQLQPDVIAPKPAPALGPFTVPVLEPAGASETIVPNSEPESGPPPMPGQTTIIEPAQGGQPESDYDRLLFGETMMASAESAAVRFRADEAVEQFDEPAADAHRAGALDPPVDSHAQVFAPVPRALPPIPPPLSRGLIAGIPSFGAPPPPRPTQASPQPPPVPAPWTDHDGETVMVDDLRAALAAKEGSVAPPMQRPRVLLPGHPPVILDRSVIVGSRPRLTRVQGGRVPHLITVQSPNGEISRSHVEIRVEHAAVLAVDLNSTNGTVLLRLGSEPMRLHPGEAHMLVAGDRLDLGDGLMIAFEGLR